MCSSGYHLSLFTVTRELWENVRCLKVHCTEPYYEGELSLVSSSVRIHTMNHWAVDTIKNQLGFYFLWITFLTLILESIKLWPFLTASICHNWNVHLHSLILTSCQQHWLIHHLRLRSRKNAAKHLKAHLSDSPISAGHFFPSAKEHKMMCQIPSQTFLLLFIISSSPMSSFAVTCCLIPPLYVQTFSPLILFPKLALFLRPAQERPDFLLFPSHVCSWKEKQREQEGREKGGDRCTDYETKQVRCNDMIYWAVLKMSLVEIIAVCLFVDSSL